MSGLILVTGATGFVGRQVMRVLSELGIQVRAVVHAGEQEALVDPGNIESVVTTDDLFAESVEWCKNICQDIDTVIHTAWYTEPGKYLQSDKNIDQLAGTMHLAKGAAKAKVRRWVGIGTCFEYDLAGGVLSVDTPLRPTTPYAGAKAAVFLALAPWCHGQGMEFAWCRLFYLYGEYEDPRRFAAYLRAQLSSGKTADLTSGRQIRDFLDVREAARLIVQTALGSEQGAVNICSGIPITLRQFAEQIADDYGRRDLLNFGARPDNLVDPPCVVGIRHKG
jgi:nucleoside-diphosphate-sugar epimerase